MSAVVTRRKRWRDMSGEERQVHRDTKAAAAAADRTFSDVKLSELEAARYLRISAADVRRLLADGRVTLWRSDLVAYRSRQRDLVPGEAYVPRSRR